MAGTQTISTSRGNTVTISAGRDCLPPLTLTPSWGCDGVWAGRELYHHEWRGAGSANVSSGDVGSAGNSDTMVNDGACAFVVSSATDINRCYIEGTRIAATARQVKVEDLAIGDVVEMLHGGLQKIKSIGQRG